MRALEVTLQIQDLLRDVTSALAPALAREGLTPVTAQALWAADPAWPPPTMQDLSRTLHCNASNTTFVVGQLEERGLAERGPDSEDGRRRVVRLTASGREARARLLAELADRTPMARLTGAQLDALSALLRTASEEP